jgi:Peptidase family S41.
VRSAGHGLAEAYRDERELAEAVTADLQSVNDDKHLRLLYHDQPMAPENPGTTRRVRRRGPWAQQTCGGVATVQRLAGNVGYLDLQPILFPAVISGELITAAMSLVAATEALIIDVRQCLGGEPAMAAFLISYLWDHDPVQLTGLQERQDTSPGSPGPCPMCPAAASARPSPFTR